MQPEKSSTLSEPPRAQLWKVVRSHCLPSAAVGVGGVHRGLKSVNCEGLNSGGQSKGTFALLGTRLSVGGQGCVFGGRSPAGTPVQCWSNLCSQALLRTWAFSGGEPCPAQTPASASPRVGSSIPLSAADESHLGAHPWADLVPATGGMSQPSPGWAVRLFLLGLPWVGRLRQGEQTPMGSEPPLPCDPQHECRPPPSLSLIHISEPTRLTVRSRMPSSA